MRSFWDQVFLNNTIRDWIIAVLIIACTSFSIWIFKMIILGRLKKIASRTKTDFDDFFLRLLQKGIIPLAHIYGIYFGLQYLSFNVRVQKVLHIAILFITTFFIVRLINLFIQYVFERAVSRSSPAEHKKPARGILLIATLVTWLIGIVFLIDNLGYDITTIVTGLGIGGIAIALAAQTILGDLFSYMVIFFDKPFEIGDFIIVDDKMGTVEYVGIKTTRIRTLNGEQLICSNTDLTNSRVHNYKRMMERRVVFSFGVVYNTSHEKLQHIPSMVRSIIESLQGTRFDRAHFLKFGDYSLDFEVVYYALTPDYNVYMDIQQSINLLLFKKFAEEKIDFAFPTQNIIIENNEQKQAG